MTEKKSRPTYIHSVKNAKDKKEVFKYINHKNVKKFDNYVAVDVEKKKIQCVYIDMCLDVNTSEEMDALIDILKRGKEYLKHKEELEKNMEG